MIVGRFDDRGRPYVAARVVIERFGVNTRVPFLLDTGADRTSLHPRSARRARVPFDQLGNRQRARGVGGSSAYFREPAILLFDDDDIRIRGYSLELLIAEPNRDNERLPSLLGRDVFDCWAIQYDLMNGQLECAVHYADFTLDVP